MLLLVSLFGGGSSAWAQSDYTFNDGVRYSQWVINSRINDFYANTKQMGFNTYDANGTQQNDNAGGENLKFDYVPGLVAKAIIENVKQNVAYNWVKPWFYSINNYATTKAGPANNAGTLDDLNATKMYFPLYDLTKSGGEFATSTTATQCNTSINNAVTALSAYKNTYSISDKTGTFEYANGGWYHKGNDYPNQMWLDGQYMGPALLAQLVGYGKTLSGSTTEADWETVFKQFDIVWHYCWNPTDKLLYHAFSADPTNAKSSAWANATTGLNSDYWGRALGWYFLGLVDVLEYMPKSNAHYATLKGYLNQLAAGLAAKQDVTGCWAQLPNHELGYQANGTGRANYLESSATAIFTAAYLKGQRLGLFTSDYSAVAKKAYSGMIVQFFYSNDKNTVADNTIQLLGCCKSAGLGGDKGRKGDAHYYLNGSDVTPTSTASGDFYTEGKVMGAFIMAATEYERAYQNGKAILFSSDLKDSYTCDGTSDALTIEAAGANGAVIDYQWYKAASILAAGSAVDGATSSSFIPTESGYYYCKATSGGTTVESRHASVLVDEVAEPTEKFSLNVTATSSLSVATNSDNSSLTGYVTYTGATTVTIHNGKSEAADMIKSDGSSKPYQVVLNGSNSSYIKIELSNELVAGDVITFVSTESSPEYYITINDTKPTSSSTSISNKTFKIQESSTFVGQSTIYIWSKSSGKFSSMTITSPAQPVAEKPVITQQPAAYTECYVGDNLTLSVVSSGEANNSNYLLPNTGNYRRWYSCKADGTSETPQANSTNMSFTVPTNKAGTFYYCYKCSNASGVATSQIATVVVKAKSNATLPAPAGCNVAGTTITVPAFEMAEAGEAKVLNLNLPTGATATVTSDGGTGATINNGVLTYTAPASGANASIAIRVTAEDGTTTADYTVAVSTKANTKLVTYAANDANFGTVTAVYTDGGATFNSGDEVPEGTRLTLTATPNPGYKFDYTESHPWGNATGSAENPLTYTIKDRKGFVARFVPLTAPVISSEVIADAKYTKNAAATALSVTATASEGGSLSYQWYKGTSNTASGGTPIDGATNQSYIPLNDAYGITYYYCVVTETVAMKADASKANGTATVTSSVAKITTAADNCDKDHTGTIYGAIDQTTPYRQARTNVFELKEGEKKVFRFTNHGNSEENWHNWNVAIVSSTDLNVASDDMVFRADNYGWGAIFDNGNHSIKMNGGGIDWTIFKSDMNNADVEVEIDYTNSSTITVKATSFNGKYVETATSSETSGTKGVYFFVDQSHFCDFRELVPVRAAISNGTLNSITVNETSIASPQNNTDYFVEQNAKVVITATPNSGYYFKNWSVTGTAGEESVNGETNVYTIANINGTATTVKAKYELKSGETLPRPANSEFDGDATITLPAFGSGAANNPQIVALNLPEYATAVVKSGSTGSVEGDNLTITAPAQSQSGETVITVTAQNGSTKDYTIRYSTSTAPSYNFVVNAVKEGGNVLMKITEGNASSVTVTYPQYILSGTTLYNVPQAADNPGWYRKTFDITEAGTYNVTYSGTAVNDVVFYTEGENIPGMIGTAATGSPLVRSSNGAAGYNNNGQYYLATTIPAGAYTISARGMNGNSQDRTAIFKAGDNEVYRFTVTKNENNSLGTSQPFYIDKETEIYVACDGSSASGLDWFYIKKADVLPVTVNEQKFAATQAVITNVLYASTNGSPSVSSETTKNGVKGKFYDLKNNNYPTIEKSLEVKFTGALGFKVDAYHGSSETRTFYVQIDNGTIYDFSVGKSSFVTSPIYAVSTGQHTLKLYAGNKDVYLADVIFLTEQPVGELTTKEVTKKVTESTSVETLASTSGGAISMTTTPASVAEFATVSFVNNELSITPVKAGTFTLDFSIAANSPYAAGTSTYTVNIRKEVLTMTVTPDDYSWNKTTTETQPALTQPTVVLKDEADNTINGKVLTYVSDDPTVATIDGTVIRLTAEPQGSANVYIEFAGDERYEAVSGIYSVLIEQGVSHKFTASTFDTGAPLVGTEKTLYDVKKENGEWVDDETKPLVHYTFGGWKWGKNDGKNDHRYDVTNASGTTSTKPDSWSEPSLYSGSGGTKPTYVDGYKYAASGAQDAMDESKILSDSPIFGSKRNGWFQSENDDPHVRPFTLPVRGSYIKYEPQANGYLTVYLLQNGAFNTVSGDDGKSYLKVGDFQPHAFHVVDQNGTPVPTYTDFQFIVKEHVTQKHKDGTPIICSYEGTTVTNDLDNGFVPNGVTFSEYDVATWPMFYSNYSKKERQDIKDAWSSGIMGAQKVVKLHNGSFFLTQKAYVKYTFYVAASQTYYIFSNFSKIGMSGINFVKDENQPDQVNDVLALNDAEKFPNNSIENLKDASTNVSKKLSIPQYGKITVNRSFASGVWNTICLPFDMTEREVRENFGDGVQILCFDGTEQGGSSNTLHFVYHEIQSILAGYPYLIRPSKTVSDITVYNKLIQPKNNGTAQSPSLVYTEPKGFVDFSASRYWCGTPYVAETEGAYTFKGTIGAQTPFSKGDVYMNTTGDLQRLTATSANLKGYRAYLKSNTVENDAKPLSIIFNGSPYDDNNEATGIIEITEDENGNDIFSVTPVNGIYNLNGQKVANDLRNLPKGMYIINGKKYYVK